MGLFAIDVGIGDTLQAINGILARRESERATVWDSLEHQLQAVSLTVGELDRMYFALLAEIEAVFTQPEISVIALIKLSIRRPYIVPMEGLPYASLNAGV